MGLFSYPDNQLQYILVKDELKHISEYEGLTEDRRPKNARCPECKEFVVLKTIARKKRAHFAHNKDNTCPANTNEGAAHLNTKIYIKTLLMSASRVEVRLYCTKRGCYSRPEVILADWDEVEDEYLLEKKRLDIAVISKGRLIGALEVHDTTEITEEKISLLSELSIPWVEVKAKMDQDHIESTGDNAILIKNFDRISAMDFGHCSQCGGALSPVPIQGTKVIKMRILDFYEKTGSYGGPLRAIYFLSARIEEGLNKEWLIDKLETINEAVEIHRSTNTKITAEEHLIQVSKSLLKDEYWRIDDGEFSVDDWGWFDTEKRCSVAQSMTRYEPKNQWDNDNKKWRNIQALIDEVYGISR